MKFTKFFWLCALALITSGCGGGSSGANKTEAAPKNDFSLQFSQTNISTKCYSYERCSVKIRADYQGTRPSGTIYIVSSLGEKVDFYYSLNDTYADLTFSAPWGIGVGHYKGNISIDICGDQYCSKRHAPRYTFPYEWTVMNTWPIFSYGLLDGSQHRTDSHDIWLSSKMGIEPDTYELAIGMPGEATHIKLPEDFINLYQIVQVSDNIFHLKPPSYPANRQDYSFLFTGPNDYSRSFDVSVRHQFFTNPSPLPEQVISASFADDDFFLKSRPVVIGNYANSLCGEASLNTSIAMLSGSSWLSKSSEESSCYLSVLLDSRQNTHGIYEGTITTRSDKSATQILPVIMAYSKSLPGVMGPGISIYPDTTPEILQGTTREFAIIRAESTFVVSAVSPWISDLQLTYDMDGFRNYNYSINIDEFKKINPIHTATRWEGIAKIDNTNPNGNFGLVNIDVSIKVPLVYAIETKTASANTVFSEKIYGSNLWDFKGVEIIKLGLDANGSYTKEISKKFYASSYESDALNNAITFDMPPLNQGVYKLNFSGIFSHHFPDFRVEIK